ncbi:MAG: RNase adapter RapZ [Firmicutes bacterium]|nr:RNase adapter RapZ [Bacillota bacterium]
MSVFSANSSEIHDVLLVTGMSGAGKSQVMIALEDNGYFCVDNLPPSLLLQFIQDIRARQREPEKMAIAVDVRGGEKLENLTTALNSLKKENLNYRVVFLDASNSALIGRYKATRRCHPLASEGLSLLGGIIAERERLEEIHGLADIIIDTTDLKPRHLAEHIGDLFAAVGQLMPLISICSFGYKYGLPLDADLAVDVRFLPNPYYIAELKPLTGQQHAVRSFVLKQAATQEFMRRYLQLLRFLLPQYSKEGKHHLLLAIGCTGGRHRSVAIAEAFTKRLRMLGYQVILAHRDIEKGN